MIKNYFQLLQLGFHFDGDLNELSKFLPSFDVSKGRYIDLEKLRDLIDDIEGFYYPYEQKQRPSNSLANFALLIVGKMLSKFETNSLWSRRPLREEQAVYAALDAYILIRMINELEKHLEKATLDNLIEESRCGVKKYDFFLPG